MHSRALLAVTALLLAFLAPQAHSETDELQKISQLIGRGQHAEAEKKLEHYLAVHPGDVQGVFIKGILLGEQKKTAEAIRLYSDLIKQNPTWPEPYNNLAVLYASQGQYERARQALETALRTHPSYAAVHDNLSGIYAAMASEAYGKALKTDDTTTRPQPRLAMVGLPYAEKQALAIAANTLSATPTPIKAASTPVAKPILAASAAATPIQTALTPVAAPMAKPAAQPTEPLPKAAAESVTGDPTSPIEATIKGWAKAWSRQDVDKYLDYYADNFKTPNGEGRRTWEQARRSRIKSPQSITVDISNLKIENNGNRAKVRFKQNYRADSISKRTNKTLILNRNGNRWLIVEELAR